MRESTPTHSDHDLIESFLLGDGAALAEIDGWILAVVRHRAWRFSADHDDLLQECRLKLLRGFDEGRFGGRSSLKTFVQAVAKHTCLDAVRRAAVRRSVPLPADGATISPELLAATADQPDEQLRRQQELRVCFEVLAGLPAPCRALFRMLLHEEKGYAEMAAELGVALGTVKSRLARCRDLAVARRRRVAGRSDHNEKDQS